MQSAVTVSLVPQARGGPFVFWDDLPAAAARAAELGFDAIEVFGPSAADIEAAGLRRLLESHHLRLAALGTGGGWVLHKLSLTSPDPDNRRRAADFIKQLIDFGSEYGAPAIIGSMQGRWGDGVEKSQALNWLGEGLSQLGRHAEGRGVHLLYEPLNRYETNLVNTLADGVALLQSAGAAKVRLLADLYHMNIEEQNLPAALRAAGPHVGQIHFVDSNRRPAGCGHTDFRPIVAALRDISFTGYLSAEALPWPDSDSAARYTIETYRAVTA